VLDPLIVDALIAHRVRLARSPLARLSAREPDVPRHMAEGANNARIAGALHVSESAVSKHIGAIFTKLGLVEDASSDRRVLAVSPSCARKAATSRQASPDARQARDRLGRRETLLVANTQFRASTSGGRRRPWLAQQPPTTQTNGSRGLSRHQNGPGGLALSHPAGRGRAPTPANARHDGQFAGR
jgi:DNA-binding CsgD family transcriptional regulator